MSVILVHPLSGEETAVSGTRLSEKCTLFKDRLVSPYAVKSSISIEVFREFVSSLEGKNVAITTANFAGLSLLCEEFGFSGLSARLSAFAGDPEDGEARRRIAALEERAHTHDCETAALQAEVTLRSAPAPAFLPFRRREPAAPPFSLYAITFPNSLTDTERFCLQTPIWIGFLSKGYDR